MTPNPPHNRKLGLLAISLTMARTNNRYEVAAFTAIRDELEQILIKSDYLTAAPFSWVSVAVRYGIKDEDIPHYQRINPKYGDLPLAIEVDTNRLMGASLEQFERIIRVAVLRALIHAGEKYKRTVDALKDKLIETNRQTI